MSWPPKSPCPNMSPARRLNSKKKNPSAAIPRKMPKAEKVSRMNIELASHLHKPLIIPQRRRQPARLQGDAMHCVWPNLYCGTMEVKNVSEWQERENLL